MPTGYTNKIAEGISFEDFVWACARAFGALVTMRDASADAPIPKELKPNEYYKSKLQEIEKELAEVQKMKVGTAAKRAKKEYEEQLRDKANGTRKALGLRQQYKDMLIKVNRWQPPTPDHQGLKDFMVEQITSSIDFDCRTTYYENQQIRLLSGQEWRDRKIGQLQKDLAYHSKEYLEEIERVAARNNWLQELRKSLANKPA